MLIGFLEMSCVSVRDMNDQNNGNGNGIRIMCFYELAIMYWFLFQVNIDINFLLTTNNLRHQ